MARFHTRDVFPCAVAASPAPPHNQAGGRWGRRIAFHGNSVRARDQVVWAGCSSFCLLPAIAGPLGFCSGSLPTGVRIGGPRHDDKTAIVLARLPATDWQG